MTRIAIYVAVLITLATSPAWAVVTAEFILTVNHAAGSPLPNGTYVVSNGSVCPEVRDNPARAIPANPNLGCQWIWNGTQLSSNDLITNGFPNSAYLADNNSGFAFGISTGSADSWTLAANGSGWTWQDQRTNNFLSVNSSGVLVMASSGSLTPTVWQMSVINNPPQFSISPTTINLPDNTGSGATIANFVCTTSGIACSPNNWTASGLPPFASPINASTGALLTSRALTSPDDGGYSFSVSDGTFGPQTIQLNVTTTTPTISPTQGGIADTAAPGTTIVTFVCSGSCPSPNWTMSGAPSYVTLAAATGALTVNATPGSAADGNHTFQISDGAVGPQTFTLMVSGGGGTGCAQPDSGFGASLGLSCVASMSDDFNGTAIDTTKWSEQGIGAGLPSPQCNPNSSVSGGSLHINANSDGNNDKCTGYVHAIFNQIPASFGGNDYTEARWRNPSSTQVGGGYWIFGSAPSTTNRTEIDLFNTSGAVQCNWFLYDYQWNSISNFVDNIPYSSFHPSVLDGNYHVYGFYRDRVNHQIKFYYEGTLMATLTNVPDVIMTDYMQPQMTNWCSAGCAGQAWTWDIDYIHYYR